ANQPKQKKQKKNRGVKRKPWIDAVRAGATVVASSSESDTNKPAVKAMPRPPVTWKYRGVAFQFCKGFQGYKKFGGHYVPAPPPVPDDEAPIETPGVTIEEELEAPPVEEVQAPPVQAQAVVAGGGSLLSKQDLCHHLPSESSAALQLSVELLLQSVRSRFEWLYSCWPFLLLNFSGCC
ncbi:unnamed protein product, partial [Polarella glacialis]